MNIIDITLSTAPKPAAWSRWEKQRREPIVEKGRDQQIRPKPLSLAGILRGRVADQHSQHRLKINLNITHRMTIGL